MNKFSTKNYLFTICMLLCTESVHLYSQTPGGIANTNIKLWLKADSGITNISGVKQWNDLGPGSKHLVQNTASARPVYNTASNLINYNPTVKMDGSNDFLTNTAGILGTATYNNMNVFMVRNVPSSSVAVNFSEKCNPYRFMAHTPYGNDIYWDAGHYVAPYRQSVNWGGTFGIPQQISMTYDVLPTKQQTIRRNGRQLTTDATTAAIKGTNQPFYLGRWSDGGYFDNAFVTEYLVVGGILTATERIKIESYLAIKYGISIDQTAATNYLSSTGATVWDGAANSSNKNNIAGIARDNGSGLYQKQSRSVNTANNGNMVWMGLNTIATSNANNSGILADNSFMLWGDNGLTSTQTSEVPSSLTNGGCISVLRLAREWKVQETGTVGAVQVKFNLTGFTSATTTQSELKLLIDDDGNFGNGGTTIVEATSYDPVTKELTFDNINFTNGQYFTLVLDLMPSSPGGVSSGLALWLKADKGVNLSGTTLSAAGPSGAWADQSPNGRNIDYVYSNPQWIDSSINFNPVIRFDGDDWMRIDNASKRYFYSTFTSGDVFSVQRNFDVANRSSLYYFGGASWGHHYTWGNGYIYSGYGSSIRKAWLPNNSTPPVAEGPGLTTQGPAFNPMHVQIFNQHSATNNWRAFFNGRQQAATTNNTVNFIAYGNVHIGAYPGLGNYFGIIPEIINYNRVLSDAEKNLVNSYLAVKYGLTLDQTVAQNYTASGGSPIFWNAAANTIYKNNIVGIGRDDCGGLYQKQSRGSLTCTECNMVGIGLDSIKSSNLNNKSTFSADKSFLMIAHDGTTGTKTTELPTSFANPCITYTRVNKEWRVQKTGTVGATNVRLYFGDLSIYSDDISEYKLLIDGDANFANGGTNIINASAINPTGKFVDFYGVNLTDGQFFTFMVDQAASAPGGVLTPTASEINGVKYELYNGLETVTDGIQGSLKQTGYIHNFTDADNHVLYENGDYFTMRLTANLKIVNAGQYQFRFLAADDNVQLLINGVNYMNRTCCGDVTGANITLSAGNHLLEVRFSEYVGAEILNLQWRAATTGLDVTTTWQSIADNKLFLTAAPTLSAWLRADKNVTVSGNGAVASGWKDQSPNGNNLTTIVGNPTYYNTTSARLTNYNPSIAFTCDQMESVDNPSGFALGKQGKTVIGVMSKPVFNGSGAGFPVMHGLEITKAGFGIYTTNAELKTDVLNDNVTPFPSFTANNKPLMLSGVYRNSNITTTLNVAQYGDGRVFGPVTKTDWASQLNEQEDFSIGTHVDYTYGCTDVNMNEVIYYPWDLTAAERSRVESYLAIKWGISLDQTVATNYVDGAGSTIWNATTFASHKNNITGIGRDDCSGLKQKQSKSVNTSNTGNLVAIGRDTIANSNGENTASFTADKSFLIWGDDNGGVTEVSTEIPTAITAGSVCTKGKRISREWRVAVTNYTEHNMVQFNLARLNLLTRATSEFKLMVDADGDFTTGATLYSATSKVDSFLNFDNITFTNGQYFSLLTSDDEAIAPGGVSANIRLWLESDAGVTLNGSTVSQWDDQSGLGHHVSQGTAGQQPTYRTTGGGLINYNPTLDFDGANDVLSRTNGMLANGTTYTGATLFFINTADNPAASKSIFMQPVVGTGLKLYSPWVNTQYLDLPLSNRISATNTTLNAGIPVLTTGVNDNSRIQTDLVAPLDTSTILFSNGRRLVAGNAVNSYTGNNGLLDIGNHTSTAEWHDGKIGEVIFYSAALSPANRQRVNSYLAIKWGITLDQTTPTSYIASDGTTQFWNATTNGNYKNNIAGIGRDICQGLHQKQSRSLNRTTALDSAVAMGITEVFESNAENTDTLANLSFMMWADDGANGTNMTEVPSALTNGGCIGVRRLNREWRIQETGTVGAVQLVMSLGGVAPKSTEISDIRLLIDADSNFSNGGTTIVSPTSYDETTQIATFDNVNFTNGQFFTFVTNIAAAAPGGVATTTQSVNGVAYSLFSGYDSDLATVNGVTLMQSGYCNNLTNPDDLVLNEIGDNFTMVCNTRLSITTAGVYQFQANAVDDRIYLIVNGTPVITTQANGTFQSANITLGAGLHTIEARFSENAGAETFQIQWRGTTAGLDVGTSFVDIADNKLFLPSAPSISAWHRADKGIDNTGEGTNTLTWEDQSSNGNDVTLGAGTPLYYKTTPAQLINYNPVVLAADDRLQSADHVNGMPFGKQAKTLFSVVTKTTFNIGSGWILGLGRDGVANSCVGFYTSTSTGLVTAAASSVGPAGFFASTDNNVPKLMSGTVMNNNITATNNVTFYGNGRALTTDTRNWISELNDNGDYAIAAAPDVVDGHDGKIVETIYYPWILNFGERQKVNSYLNLKYGMTPDTSMVASDSSTIWNELANLTYHNNVAGIGRDDCSGLNQKQSRSVNPTNDGSMLAIGNYTLANSNSENMNNFTSDKSFIIWGDNAATGTTTSEVPSAQLDPNLCRAFRRLNREWKVQETGTVGEVEMRFHLGTTYSNAASTIGDFKLLVKNNSDDFSSGVTIYNATSFDGTNRTVSFGNINLINNDYFTLVVDDAAEAPGGVKTSLVAWHRADKGVTATTSVSAWADQSASGLNATQGTGGNQPTYNTATNLANFNPCIRYDGTNDHFSLPSGLANFTAGLSAFVIARPTASNIFARYFDFGNGTANNNIFLTREASTTSMQYGVYNSATPNGAVVTNQITNNEWLMHGVIQAGGTAGTTNIPAIFLNGRDQANADNTHIANNVTRTINYIARSNWAADAYYAGDLPELVLYNDDLSAGNQQRVNSYLALKYGLTLNQSTPQNYLASDSLTLMWNATSGNNPTYKNRIAGLGRDDCSGLYQKQSQSQVQISDSTVLSMALTSFETSNATNLNTIDSNRTFLVWGDDGGALAEQSTEIPAAINANGTCNQGLRIGREWKVQQTAGKEIGYVQVKMDIDALGLNSTRAVNKFRLVKHNSNDFTSATEFIEPASFTSGVLTFDNVFFSDTVTYLTLVTDTTLTIAPGGVLAGLQAWYKAETGVSTATGVSQWDDQSLFSRHATQATGANQPTYSTTGTKLINYNPSISLTAASHVLTISGGIPNVNVNAFAASRKGPQNIDWNTLLRGFSADHLMITGQSNNNLGYFDNTATASNKLSGYTFVSGQVGILGAYTRTTGTQGWNSVNGRNGTIYNNILESDIGGIGYIGNCGVCATQQWGDISEVAIYNTATMTATERQRIESYMALKYGVTLDQTTATNYIASDGTTLMWNATTGDNPAFSKNIAGIGRDFCSGLYQKQSRSVNNTAVDDSMVAMALTGFEATNAANSSTIDTNLSFMVWGDNGLTGTTTSEVPTAALDALGCKTYKRLRREWKVQETKTVGTVAVRFHLGTTYTSSNSVLADFKLLVDTDSTFSNATTIVSATSYDATNKIVVFSYNFSNNDYFTLVIDNAVAPGGVGTNLARWYRADKSVTVSGSNVTVWDDQSVSARNATGVNNPQYNTTSNLINFNPSISFNGTNQHFTFSDIGLNAGANNRTMIGVGTTLSTDATGRFMYTYGSNTINQMSALARVSQIQYTVGWGSQDHTIANVWTNTTDPRIVYGDYNGTQSRGAFDGGSITGTARSWNTVLSGTGYIGRNVVGEFWSGRITELISYNSILSTTELQRVNTYLAIKYGRTLNQSTAQNYLASDGTTIPWDATTADNPSFKWRIAGIGRDDCSGLDQRQSQSQDSISAFTVLTVGNDTIRTSNALNTSEFINNLSFLMWGDNNGSLSEQITEVPSVLNVGTCGAGKRIGREWKVQKTGTIDALQLRFDITRTNINTRDASRFRLAVHSSSDFTGATTFYRPSSFTSGVLTFDGISFTADSAYMTIITDTIVNVGPGGVTANLKGWWRADIGLNNSGDTVSGWFDQSGFERTVSQPGSQLFKPRLTSSTGNINFNRMVNFDGNDVLFGTDAGLSSSNERRTFLGVATNSNTNEFRYIASYGAHNVSLNNTFSFGKSSTYNVGVSGGFTTHQTTYSVLPLNSAHLYYADKNNTQMRASRNGQPITGTSLSLTTVLNSNFNIGAYTNNTFFWEGRIGDVIVYSDTLTTSDMNKVNSYLALKYGLTLHQGNTGADYQASNGSVIWTGNSTYRFNIAGIGLDSCSALNQKQSRSQDTTQRGDIVAIGKQFIDSTNASNAVSFDANRDFLVWGSDSARGFKNTEFPASITSQACVSISRLQKEWKTQVTGTSSQTTQVRFYLDGLIPSSTSILDLKLLVDTVDSDFSNGDTRIIDAATYNETTKEVTFNNVVFKNNNYFTLLIDVYAIAPGGVTSGIQTWLRADKGITATTTVSKWADQSTNNREAVQATVGSQPTYNSTSNLMNFNQNASFDGGDALNFNHTLGMSGDVTVNFFAVHSPAADNSNLRVILGENPQAAGSWSSGIFGNNKGILDRNGVNVADNDSAYTAGSVNILGWTKNTGNTATDWLGYHNGKLTKTVDIASPWVLNANNKVLGGQGAGPSFAYVGRMGDVAVYVGALTYVERNRIESYMALKYGITLDQSGSGRSYRASYGSIIWDSAVNATYNRRIFGIGRDFCSGLYQKQSASAHTGGVLTLSLNSLSSSNANNIGSFAKDSMFTIIGDNGGAMTQISSDLPATISTCASRLTREWKAQVTGDAVEAEYRFDVSTVTGRGTLVTDYRIIVDEDGNGDFTNGTVRIFDASSYASNIVTFSDLKINNGEVFTLVTKGATVGQVALTSTSTKVTSISNGCSVNGWTYYTDPVDTTKLVIAIFKNGNTVNVDSITINTGDGYTDANLSKGRKVPDERAVSIMKRLIQVNAPGTFTVNGGVKVRLYYAQSEIDDVTPRMNQLKSDSNILGATLPFMWFKTKKTIPQIISTMTAFGVDAGTPDSTRVSWSLSGDSSGVENGIKFIQLHGIKTFSTFGGGVTVANSTPLPVELLDFKGEKREDASHLNWQTASEKNSDKFEIERATNSQVSQWEKLGEVKAAGLSQFIQNYSFVDIYPEKAINYYRLKMIDNDGSYEYSKIVALDYRKLGLMNISVYPNPMDQSFFIDAKGHDKDKLTLKMYDPLGRMIWSESYEVRGTYDKREFHRPLYATSGVYMLKLVNESTNDENSVQLILK